MKDENCSIDFKVTSNWFQYWYFEGDVRPDDTASLRRTFNYEIFQDINLTEGYIYNFWMLWQRMEEIYIKDEMGGKLPKEIFGSYIIKTDRDSISFGLRRWTYNLEEFKATFKNDLNRMLDILSKK